jgi:CheY-like chemotaxis protein
VDDNEFNIDALSMVLLDLGYNTDRAFSGDEAVIKV